MNGGPPALRSGWTTWTVELPEDWVERSVDQRTRDYLDLIRQGGWSPESEDVRVFGEKFVLTQGAHGAFIGLTAETIRAIPGLWTPQRVWDTVFQPH